MKIGITVESSNSRQYLIKSIGKCLPIIRAKKYSSNKDIIRFPSHNIGNIWDFDDTKEFFHLPEINCLKIMLYIPILYCKPRPLPYLGGVAPLL